MGKGTELWDDSALINAFNHAMDTYKAMHRENYPANPLEEVKNNGQSNDDEAVESESLTREGEDDRCENNFVKGVTEICMPYNKNIASEEGLQSHEDSQGANICVTQDNLYSSEFPVVTAETYNGNDQQIIEYNNILKQYYELEEQRQKILQKLQQANYWNYQNPIECREYQAENVLNTSANHPQPHFSSSSCHCSANSLIPTSACVMCCPSFGCLYCQQSCCLSLPHQLLGGQDHAQNGISSSAALCKVDMSKETSQTDDRTVRKGMMVAEKALNSVKAGISLDSTLCEEKGKGKAKEGNSAEHECEASGGTTQETDLSVVLSAWYSAGFHTGRYLSEQSRKKASF